MKNSLFLFALILIRAVTPVYADVTLDGTMGTAGHLSGPEYDIKAEYGQEAGSNLFHSFGEFNINTGEIANFGVSGDIQNIIGRITGGAGSWIDGTLTSTISGTSDISGANLYLLNPAGMMFGPHATLNLGGSFHVSTADYLVMGPYERFYVQRNNQVLSTAPPSAFGFLDDTIEKITYEGAGKLEEDSEPKGLTVSEGQTISVVAGDIEINGTYYQPSADDPPESLGNLNAPQGRINLISAASPGQAVLTESGADVSSLSKMGNITLSDHALVKSSGEGSGNIYIRSGTFFAENQSAIEADASGDGDGGVTDIQVDTLSLNNSNIFSDTQGNATGGSISVRAAESVTLSGSSRIFADATGQGSPDGSAGSVLIETKDLSMNSGAIISSETYGKSRGGDVVLRAEDSVSLSDESQIYARSTGYETETEAGPGGTVRIESKDISLSAQSRISSDTYGGGSGGNITIKGYDENSSESINVSESSIYAGTTGSGDGGKVEISAEKIAFTSGGLIGSESFSQGKGGDVILRASEAIRFSGANDKGEDSKIYTTATDQSDDAGDAGNISLEAPYIIFTDGGGITASTQGPGNAGVIAVKAYRLVMDRGSVSSASESEGQGGDAGHIEITAEDSTTMENQSSITTETAGYGNAGDITLTTYRLELDSNSSVSSESTLPSDEAGSAGTITLDICDSLVIKNGASVTTEAEGAGGGKIFVKAEELLYLLDGAITSSVKQGQGQGGDVTVGSLTPEGKKQGAKYVILNRSDITANADYGDGGAIFIITENYLRSDDSSVTATSRRGNDGTVRIEAPDVDISGALIVLPESYLDATQWMKKSCAERSGEKVSRFVIKGRDALGTSLKDLRPGQRFWLIDD